MGGLVTEAWVQSILDQPMTASGQVQWRKKAVWWECSLVVGHPDPSVRLRLVITVNDRARSKASVSLLLDSAHRIRGLDIMGSHQNSHTDRNLWLHQAHKHKWTDACHGS